MQDADDQDGAMPAGGNDWNAPAAAPSANPAPAGDDWNSGDDAATPAAPTATPDEAWKPDEQPAMPAGDVPGDDDSAMA